jgi:hypothetical protein
LESLSSGIATEGDDVGLLSFVADALPPPKGRDFPVKVPPESPTIRIVVDPKEAAWGRAKTEIATHLREKGLCPV